MWMKPRRYAANGAIHVKNAKTLRLQVEETHALRRLARWVTHAGNVPRNALNGNPGSNASHRRDAPSQRAAAILCPGVPRNGGFRADTRI